MKSEKPKRRQASLSSSLDWRFGVFLLLAIGARFVFSHDTEIVIQGDALSYYDMAKHLVQNGYLGEHSLPDARRPPLYPLLIAAVYKLFGLDFGSSHAYTAVNCVIDALSLVLLRIIGKRAVGPSAALGICLAAVSPVWFAHVNMPITEDISILFFLAFLERWTREKRSPRDEIWAGVHLSLLALSRSMFSVFPFAVLGFELLFRGAPQGARIEGVRRRLQFVAASYALPCIWGIRNLITLGQFITTQTGTGVLMGWLAMKIPLLDWKLQEHIQWVHDHPYRQVIERTASDAIEAEIFPRMRQEVFDLAFHHPLEYLRALQLPAKTWRLWAGGWWNPYPYIFSPPQLGNVYVWGMCLPILVLGSIGLARRWTPARGSGQSPLAQWRATRMLLLILLYLTAVTLPFTVDARYSLIGLVSLSLWCGAALPEARRGATET